MIKLDSSFKILPEPQTISILDKKWEYCGEGNCNIVISIQDEMKVVRFSKIPIGGTFTEETLNEQKKKIERELIYGNVIFGKIIGKDYVGHVKIIRVNPDEFSKLNELLKSKRPLNRLHKELGSPYGTLRDNFARISNSHVDYCIEIKPKQGWWSKSINGKPVPLCTFCLKQFLKRKNGNISNLSNYCPLDLYSGNATQMIRGVISLMRSPQNNFRLFRNGQLIYGERNSGSESLEIVLREWYTTWQNENSSQIDSTSQNGCSVEELAMENIIYLICFALLTPRKLSDNETIITNSDDILDQIKTSLQKKSSSLIDLKSIPSTIKENCMESSSNLPNGSILSRILAAQKLGKWAGEMPYKLYPRICPVHHGKNEIDCPSRKCGQEDKWLDEIDDYSTVLNKMECLAIEQYLLAATAKDCSIMIAFSTIQSSEVENSPRKRSKHDIADSSNIIQVEDLYGNYHKVKVGVADLDPKPLTSISRHYLRDLAMYEAFN